ncbi:uncharacterized protein LOC107473743 [Arachis duranensis]|uniref:Uncharacterized protein LOC107473743 n=1 Tax=Arachis duranensis TaxID=130453 RepID=A0A6P4CCJ3_ARADU|nr:uncharacterized protein LOC107473743 [Arachis duranensis]
MKIVEEAQNLTDTVTNNQYFYAHQRQRQPIQKKGVFELERVDTILAQNKLMHQQIQQQIELMTKRIDGLQVAAVYTASQPSNGWSHSNEASEKRHYEQQLEQVQYMHNTSNSSQNEFHGDTYNPSWKNHPNLKWVDNQNSWQKNHNFNNSRNINNQSHSSNNTNQYKKPQNSYQQPNNNLQIHQNNFFTPHLNSQNNYFNIPNNFQQQPSYPNIPFIDHHETWISVLEATLQALAQTTQDLAKGQAERPTNILPSDTISNPKEECKAIQHRNGRTLEGDKANNKEGMTAEEKDQENLNKKEEEPQASKKGKQVMEEHPQEKKKEVKPYTPPFHILKDSEKKLKDQ